MAEESGLLEQTKNSTSYIKIWKTRVFWHLIRMEKHRIISDAKPDGKRVVGRPELRWLDDVQADLKIIWIK